MSSTAASAQPWFALGDDHKSIVEQLERFAKDRFWPLQEKMDDEEWWPEEVFPALGELGYLGCTVPEELGGAGLDFFSSALVLQAVAKWNPSIGLALLAHENLCLNNILHNATPELCARYVPGMSNGTIVGCLGLTEPGAGSDALGSMRTTAKRDGDHYVLNGTKLYITNGPIAQVCLVYAKTSPEKGAHGITAFAVDTDLPGFEIAQKMKKMGMRGSQTAEIVLRDCRVPVENVVGEVDRGVKVVMSGLDLERIGLAFMMIGMCERALELSVDYAKSREQFGEKISQFQFVQGMVADIYAETESLRSFCYQVAAEVNHLEAGDVRGEVSKRAAAVVLQAGLVLMRCVDRAVQIHGGSGYIWEMEVNRLYRAGKLLQIGAGTNEVRRIIIAREILGR
ncbi:MAG: isovaleryl-CoA dehydrogenase [Solirubrobacterales bacterium]|nr:isovaleryl-CoA dehydrogenase [Solirubrobacterales bacterium]